MNKRVSKLRDNLGQSRMLHKCIMDAETEFLLYRFSYLSNVVSFFFLYCFIRLWEDDPTQ